MTTAYQHRPLSKILAPAPGQEPAGEVKKDQPREANGQFAAPESKTEFNLPEKYRGKSPEEIAQMHINAEKELGRLRNEVGSYRGLVSDLTSLKRQTEVVPDNAVEDDIEVSGDDILVNPKGAIDKVVTHRLNELDRKQKVAQEATKFELEQARLMSDFPDLDAVVGSEEFQKFASRTSSRQQDLVTAATAEGLEQVRAARRLLEDFTDFQTSLKPSTDEVKPEKKTEVQRAAAVRTEGSGPAGNISTKPLIYESDVLKLIQTDPAKYRSPSYQAELMSAIKERRFVKNS